MGQGAGGRGHGAWSMELRNIEYSISNIQYPISNLLGRSYCPISGDKLSTFNFQPVKDKSQKLMSSIRNPAQTALLSVFLGLPLFTSGH